MTGADQEPLLSQEPYFSAPALRPGTPVWSEASARPDEDIREFIRVCLSDSEQDGVFTELAPWQEQWVRQALESGSMGLPGIPLMRNRARGFGKTSEMKALQDSLAPEWKGPSPQFMIVDELLESERSLRAYKRLRERDPLWQALQVVASPAVRFVDTRSEDVFPRRSRPSLALALQSEVCLSRTLLPAEGGTRSHPLG